MFRSSCSKAVSVFFVFALALLVQSLNAFAAVNAPTFSPTYDYDTTTNDTNITISTTTGGATIRYTTNGATPSYTVGTIYTGSILVNSSKTFKAIAYLSSSDISTVTTQNYIVRVGQPTYDHTTATTYTSSFNNAITTTTTSGATIYYCTDCDDTSNPPGPSHGTLYTGPITISAPVTLTSRGYKTGYNDSNIISGTYSFKVNQPQFSPYGGSFSSVQTITLSTPFPTDAQIFYTIDGSEPTSSSTCYTGPFQLRDDVTIKAKAFKTGWVDSNTVSQTYSFPDSVARPLTGAGQPISGLYINPQTITLSSSTSGFTIRYTLDGTTPSSTVGTIYYSGNISVNNQVLKAIAYKADGSLPSVVSTFPYNIKPPTIASGAVIGITLRNGSVYSWGTNYYGSVGDGTVTDRVSPVSISGLSNAIGLYLGAGLQTLALLNDGTAKSWGGENDYGELGDNTTTTRTAPGFILNDDDTTANDIISLASGNCYTLLLKNNGTVWGVGYNGWGQLGDGTTTSKNSLTQIENFSDVIKLSSTWGHVIALKSDGTIWTWGNNEFGQLGIGSTNSVSSPVQITSLWNIKDIAAGYYHSLALKENGDLAQWGAVDPAWYSDSTVALDLAPTAGPNITGVVGIQAGYGNNLALINDGSVKCWGFGYYGQLGMGNSGSTYTPVSVLNPDSSPINDVKEISTQSLSGMALKNDGTFISWGFNNNATVGDGTRYTRYTPVEITFP